MTSEGTRTRDNASRKSSDPVGKLTTVIHIKNRQEGDVYIGRMGRGEDGYFGNPYPLIEEKDRKESIESFRRYFHRRLQSDPTFKRRVRALRGKRLVCFCKPKACHGDIIAEYVNNI